jgi:hypothetical protein
MLCLSCGWAPVCGLAAARQALPVSAFLLPQWSGGLLANSAFMPAPDAAPAHLPFRGSLSLSEGEMTIKPRALRSRIVLGRDAALFPGVRIAFFTQADDLVPFTQDLIPAGSNPGGRSFWDLIVQPGRVWSEPRDGDWSRAAFPFALVNSSEGETHNGIASFLYKSGAVSNLRFQIVQQTTPYAVKERFVAAGLAPARFAPAPPDRQEAMTRTYAASLKDAVRIADWRELVAKVGTARLAGFDGAVPARDIVLAGLDYEGTFYLEECVSAAGPLPWCDRARFGIGAATTALANETALLRLAEKYGPSVFELKIADYVPEAARHPGWQNVRFEDAIDMATGIGNGSLVSSPNAINAGYMTDDYARWHEARSAEEKIRAMLDAGRAYPWGPGAVARYRDQDMFLLGVAMTNFLRSKDGAAADIWSMLETEVFEPIGIHYAPTNRTHEADGRLGQPLMAYGYYPTIGDMVRIARLYQSGGKFHDVQILYAPRVAAMLAGPQPRPGLPTGERLAFGETRYSNAFWMAPYRAGACQIYYPRMIGEGGTVVALLPTNLTGIRLARSAGSAEAAGVEMAGVETPTVETAAVETAGMVRVAERLTHFCSDAGPETPAPPALPALPPPVSRVSRTPPAGPVVPRDGT